MQDWQKHDERKMYLQATNIAKILASDLDTLNHGLFSLTDPDTRIVDLLVGLVGSFRVANLSLQIGLLLHVEVPDALPVSPLSVCADRADNKQKRSTVCE